MLNYFYASLIGFRKVFSRDRSWLLFCMVVLGFIGSNEMVGVSSFCRFWLLETNGYHSLNHFFRSSAWSLSGLIDHWFNFVLAQGHCVNSQGRMVVLGDHTDLPRDGRKMPGVVTLHQESETQSKPCYFRGQCWGAIAALVGSGSNLFAVPLMLKMHQGFSHLGVKDNAESMTMGERIVDMILQLALKTTTPTTLVLDAFFSTQRVFRMAQSVYTIAGKEPLVELIVRAKKSYVAYFQARLEDYKGIGRPAKYGDKVHLMEIFDHKHCFRTEQVRIYNKLETISLFHLDLLWKPTACLVRFVFAETSRGKIILMCSNLSQDPIAAIELYCLRVRIETMFDMLKNVICGFQCHFWSKKMKRHSRKPRSNSKLLTPLLQDFAVIKKCWDATEGFVNIGGIALGMLQFIAISFSDKIWSQFDGFLRTRSREIPSERTTKIVMAGLITQDLFNIAPSAIMREIRRNVLKGKIEEKIFRNRYGEVREAA